MPALFVNDDGTPLRFYFDATLSRQSQPPLRQKIESHGGTVSATREGITHVLISRTASSLLSVKEFEYNRNNGGKHVKVQTTGMIDKSIEEGNLAETEVGYTGMGGRLGRKMPFTPLEDRALGRYLAERIPDKSRGGRTGNNIYIELEHLGNNDPEYEWAQNHTWQAWQNRYKKSQPRFDEMIEELIPTVNPRRIHRYCLDRTKNSKALYQLKDDSDEEAPELSENERDTRQMRGNSVHQPQAGPSTVHTSPRPTLGRRRRSNEEMPPPKRQRRISSIAPACAESSRQRPVGTRGSRLGPGQASVQDSDSSDADSSHSSIEEEPEPTFVHFEDNAVFEEVLQKSPPAVISQGSTLVVTAPPVAVDHNSGSAKQEEEEEGGGGEREEEEPGSPEVKDLGQEGHEDFEPIRASSPFRVRQQTSDQVEPSVPSPVTPEVEIKATTQRGGRKSRTSAKKRTPPPPRMTRSRSRSVDPEFQILQDQARVKGKGRALARPASPDLSALQEDREEDDQPGPETLEEEEEDVRQLIIDVDDFEEPLVDQVIEQQRISPAPRDSSMESDDAKMSTQLGLTMARRPPKPTQPSPARQPAAAKRKIFKRDKRELNDLLAAFESVPSTRPKARMSMPAIPPSFNRGGAQPTPTPRAGASKLRHQVTTTPASLGRQPVPRMRSSSVESYPPEGTLASAYKRRLTQEGMKSPYKPPDGTRASMMMNSPPTFED